MTRISEQKRAAWMAARLKHGAYSDGKEAPEHYVWRSMWSRCTRKTDKAYSNYGGRGIAVCDAWKDYATFLRDMGNRPTPKHSLERRDNDRGYEPGNCEWATTSEQQRNKQSTRFYFNGYGAYTLTEAAEIVGISKELAHIRFKAWGTFQKGQIWHELQNAL